MMNAFANAMNPQPVQSRQPAAQQQAQPQQQQGQTPISPYAQSLYGSLVTQAGTGVQPQSQAQAQPRFDTQLQQQQNPMLPYINLIGQLPRSVRPGMQSPLAQILSQILASGMGIA